MAGPDQTRSATTDHTPTGADSEPSATTLAAFTDPRTTGLRPRVLTAPAPGGGLRDRAAVLGALTWLHQLLDPDQPTPLTTDTGVLADDIIATARRQPPPPGLTPAAVARLEVLTAALTRPETIDPGPRGLPRLILDPDAYDAWLYERAYRPEVAAALDSTATVLARLETALARLDSAPSYLGDDLTYSAMAHVIDTARTTTHTLRHLDPHAAELVDNARRHGIQYTDDLTTVTGIRSSATEYTPIPTPEKAPTPDEAIHALRQASTTAAAAGLTSAEIGHILHQATAQTRYRAEIHTALPGPGWQLNTYSLHPTPAHAAHWIHTHMTTGQHHHDQTLRATIGDRDRPHHPTFATTGNPATIAHASTQFQHQITTAQPTTGPTPDLHAATAATPPLTPAGRTPHAAAPAPAPESTAPATESDTSPTL